jgi:hypothetical protein
MTPLHITSTPSDGKLQLIRTELKLVRPRTFRVKVVRNHRPTIGRPDNCDAPTPVSFGTATRSSTTLDPSSRPSRPLTCSPFQPPSQ